MSLINQFNKIENMKAIYNHMKFIIKNDFPEIGVYLYVSKRQMHCGLLTGRQLLV